MYEYYAARARIIILHVYDLRATRGLRRRVAKYIIHAHCHWLLALQHQRAYEVILPNVKLPSKEFVYHLNVKREDGVYHLDVKREFGEMELYY